MRHYELTGEYIGDLVLTGYHGTQKPPNLSQAQQSLTVQVDYGKLEQQVGFWESR